MKIKRIIYAVCIFMIAIIFHGNTATAINVTTEGTHRTMQECANLINKLQIGTSAANVEIPYHEPGSSRPMEKFTDSNGQMVVIAYCRTAWVSDSQMTDDEYTPLVFTNGVLTSLGWRALGGPKTFANRALSQQQQQQAMQLELQRRQHEQNFWKGIQDFGLCLGGYITC